MSIFHLESPITELAFDRKTPSMPRLFTVGTPHKVSSVVVFVHGHRALLMVCKSHLIWGIKSHGGGRTSAIHRARLLKLKKNKSDSWLSHRGNISGLAEKDQRNILFG